MQIVLVEAERDETPEPPGTRCRCSCADICPLGRGGSHLRCRRLDLIEAAVARGLDAAAADGMPAEALRGWLLAEIPATARPHYHE